MNFLVKKVAFLVNKIPDIPCLTEKSANRGYVGHTSK
jgi:hypothetical protein